MTRSEALALSILVPFSGLSVLAARSSRRAAAEPAPTTFVLFPPLPRPERALEAPRSRAVSVRVPLEIAAEPEETLRDAPRERQAAAPESRADWAEALAAAAKPAPEPPVLSASIEPPAPPAAEERRRIAPPRLRTFYGEVATFYQDRAASSAFQADTSADTGAGRKPWPVR